MDGRPVSNKALEVFYKGKASPGFFVIGIGGELALGPVGRNIRRVVMGAKRIKTSPTIQSLI